MRSSIARLLLASLSAACAANVAHATPSAELISTAADRGAIAVTVYNDDLALVKERRKLTLPAGPVRLSLREVSARMRPETALLQAASGRPLTLIEQNFDFDLLTPQKLLDKYVGREVTVIRTNPASGAETREKASVLATTQGTVLRFADRIETGVPGRLAFDGVPGNLRDRPTLSVLLESAGGAQTLELSYLSGGLSWQADYVAELDGGGRQLDLNGWVTLTNSSGTTFENAALQLVAGQVNRVRPVARAYLAKPEAVAMAAPAPAPREEALLDYHLYSFDRPTTLADNQTKQLALLSAARVPVEREYLLAGADYYYMGRYDVLGEKLKPAVFVIFQNRGGQLGKPLPAGVVRVYARDSQGAAQFVGEDRIAHTAKNETVRLRLGEAFDISAERRQTSYKRITERSAETAYAIRLRNAKPEAVTVKVQETLPGDWEIVQQTQKHVKESSRGAVWNVTVPAEGSATLEYTARVKW
ncbi:DUF4139 domain-containing protein [Denitratisoma sp. DHT3]|uniref:DUF4139 domain-containing protein n=1 Tax=Denitratisoma sp. DHT3 TaxID=1981880 RepID=UPI001198594E|nr:DUF4139 domain-containing protein [Denitratisoma sp. DHT3]QDX82302.1 DUF4139 domain-containing protein [Denitratisoma sp. DHT3]